MVLVLSRYYMNKLIPCLLLTFFMQGLHAQCGHLKIPFQRIRFHDRIKEELQKCDKADGKIDSLIKVGSNDEVNLLVTDAFTRRINDIVCFIETNPKIPSNNDKIRQLNYVEEVVKSFRISWKVKKLNPASGPLLVDNFERILKANLDSQSMAPFIDEAPYEVGLINTEIFSSNTGYAESKKI